MATLETRGIRRANTSGVADDHGNDEEAGKLMDDKVVHW